MKKREFTLVEILVVVAIICLLLRLAFPLYSELFTGSAVDYGAQRFKSYCQMTRVYAAEKQKNVSVIILASLDDVGDKPVESDQIFSRQAYRAGILEDVFNAAGVYEKTIVNWIPMSNWQFLPEGCYFRRTAGRGEFNSAENTLTVGVPWDNTLLWKRKGTNNELVITDSKRDVGGSSSRDVLYRAFVITYKPTGELVNAARIWIGQGYVAEELETIALSDDKLNGTDEDNDFANMQMVELGRISRKIDIFAPENEGGWCPPPPTDNVKKLYQESLGSSTDRWSDPTP